MTKAASNIASLRVDKPGKSKFAPNLGKSNLKRRTNDVPLPAITSSSPSPSTQTKEAADADDSFRVDLEENSRFYLSKQTSTGLSQTRQSTIEAVAARRQQRIPAEITFDDLNDNSAPQMPKSNNQRKASNTKITMSHFLRDMGVGEGMLTSALPSSQSIPSIRTIKTQSSISTAIKPKVKIVDGEIVVDTEQMSTGKNDNDPGESLIRMSVVHDDQNRTLNSHSFVKTNGNNRWSQKDTELFWDALSMCGTDFSMISLLFPKRNREQIKGKYKIEERSNPGRLKLALTQKKSLDMNWLRTAKEERKRIKESKSLGNKSANPPTHHENELHDPDDDYTPTTHIFTSSPRRSSRIMNK